MEVLIFILTLLLSLKTNWTYHNFTYLSYQSDYRLYYLIWITIFVGYLLFKVIKINHMFFNMRNKDRLLIAFSSVSMLIGAYLPYHEATGDLVSSMHIFLSLCGVVSLMIIIYEMIKKLMLISFDKYRLMITIFNWELFIISMFIVMFGNINSIIELLITGIVLYDLHQIEKSAS